MDTTVADALLDALVDGRYRVRARLAQGGMATVYTAADERLERTVALKIIHPAQARDPRFVGRFTDEAKTIARLTHPNVVAVYDQGTHHELPYLVMEFVRGRTLRDLLAERRRLQPQEALAILEQMLAGVAAAHRAGLVHRDIKPENVLVAEAPGGTATNLVDAVVKVADFGLARAVERSAEDAGTQLMATAAYVAPELITDGHADPRTDVYSAGVVLFEMLTGRVPYDGDRPVEVAWQHVQRDIPAPSRYVPGLPAVVDDLVIRATRRDPNGRPADAGAFLTLVQSAREQIGLALATRAGPLAQPTVVVPRVTAERPAWARLPASQPTRRAANRDPGGNWFRNLLQRINSHPRGRIALAAALVALGLFAAVGGWWFGIGRYTAAPDLLNKPKAQAEAQAHQAGFAFEYGKPEYSETKAKDVVLRQNPGPAQRIPSGGTITLTLSLGPERYAVPDVAGKDFEIAVNDLRQLRLQPDRSDVYDDLTPPNSVVRTDPPAGGMVPPGQHVLVYVSKGRAPVTVPAVVGKNVDEARGILEHLGLRVAVEERDSSKPRGEVLTQDPADGAGVEKGAPVKLGVSKGPPEVAVPDYRGQPAQQAKAALEQAGFTVKIIGNENGFVVIQNPSGGTAPQGAEITLLAT